MNASRSKTLMNDFRRNFYVAVLGMLSMSMLGCQSVNQSASSSISPPSVSSPSSSSTSTMPSASANAGGVSTQAELPAMRQTRNGNKSNPAALPQTSQVGQRSGVESQLPERDITQPNINSGNEDNNNANYDVSGGENKVNSAQETANGGNYSLDRLPGLGTGSGDVVSNSGRDSQGGAMTASERAAVLDQELQRGYEEFDGFILGERERAQAQNNAIGSSGSQASMGDGQGLPQTLPSAAAGAMGVESLSRPVSTEPRSEETFAPPSDIPNGRDDDVVARQLREAAMAESDPELREALWDEYRNYTGLEVD